MDKIIAVAIGGSLGSVFRFLLSKLVQEKTGFDFPVGTLTVNLIGCFLIGLSFALFVENLNLSQTVRLLLITGFWGGFTTFSTFSYESASMFLEGDYFKLFLYLFVSNFLGIILTLLGYHLGKIL